MKIQMIALKSTVYAGHRYKVGGSIPVRGNKDAKLLRALKIASPAPAARVVVVAEVQKRTPAVKVKMEPAKMAVAEPVAQVEEAPAPAIEPLEPVDHHWQPVAALDATEPAEEGAAPAKRSQQFRRKAGRSAE